MDQVSDKQDEKRVFTRMKLDTAAEVVIRSKGKRLHAICRDLSGGGMLIESRVALPTGTELEVKLASHHRGNPMLKSRTQVARVERQAAGSYMLGLEILEILD